MKLVGSLSCLVLMCVTLGCSSGGDKNEPINKGDYTMKPPQNRPHSTRPVGAGATPSAPQ